MLNKVGVWLILGFVLVSCGKIVPKYSIERTTYNEPIVRVSGVTSELEGKKWLLRGEGYAHASDGMLAMDMRRRSSNGSLAELLGIDRKDASGRSALDKDIENKSIGLSLAIDRTVELLKASYPVIYSLLEAYAAGINDYLEEVANGKHPEVQAIYTDVTGDPSYRIAAWDPKHSVAIAVGISFYLSSSFYEKMGLGVLDYILEKLGREILRTDLVDMRPIADTFIVGNKPKMDMAVPRPTNNNNIGKLLLEGLRKRIKPSPSKPVGFVLPKCTEGNFPMPSCGNASLGSNNSVAGHQFTGRKETILASDPHLPLTFPNTLSSWAGSVAEFPDLNMAGNQIAGVPGALIGHNSFVAIGLTNNPADVNDIAIVQLNDEHDAVENEEHQMVPLITHPYRIWYREGRSLKYKDIVVKEVPGFGPIFSDDIPDAQTIIKYIGQANVLDNLALAYRWVLHEGSTSVVSILEMCFAKSIPEIHKALDKHDGASQNFVFADRKGNIGYRSPGKFPVRNYLSPSVPPYAFIKLFGKDQGFDTARLNWSGVTREGGRLDNPPGNAIVTANNDPFGNTAGRFHYVDDQSKEYRYFDNSTGIRATRYRDLIMKARGHLTVQDMINVQGDTYDLLAVQIRDRILSQVDESRLSARALSFLKDIRNWDGQSRIEKTEPVFFYEFLSMALKNHWDMPTEAESMISVLRKFGEEVKDALRKGWPLAAKNIFEYDEESGKARLAPIAIKTWYHHTLDRLDRRAPFRTDAEQIDLRNKTQDELKRALEAAADNMYSRNKVGRAWGEFNFVRFYDSLGGLYRKAMPLPIAQHGALDTVRVAAPGYGQNLLWIATLSDNGITAVNGMPGGNHASTDVTSIYPELISWRNNERRPFPHW